MIRHPLLPEVLRTLTSRILLSFVSHETQNCSLEVNPSLWHCQEQPLNLQHYAGPWRSSLKEPGVNWPLSNFWSPSTGKEEDGNMHGLKAAVDFPGHHSGQLTNIGSGMLEKELIWLPREVDTFWGGRDISEPNFTPEAAPCSHWGAKPEASRLPCPSRWIVKSTE